MEHTAGCESYMFEMAVENLRDSTGEYLYDLPLDFGQGGRTFQSVQAELTEWANGYHEFVDCDCAADAEWQPEATCGVGDCGQPRRKHGESIHGINHAWTPQNSHDARGPVCPACSALAHYAVQCCRRVQQT